MTIETDISLPEYGDSNHDNLKGVPLEINESTNQQSAQDLNALILAIAKDKDRQAFVTLFNTMSSRLKSYAMRCGANESDAEEIVQESMITVWNKAYQFNPQTASASTWLYTIIRNRRIDFARKDKSDLAQSIDLWPDPGGDELEDEVESDLNVNLVRNLIETLPEEQRQIVFKVYFEGKSHSEIAAELDLPLGTIKSRLRLAMKKLDTLAKEQMTWLIIILLMNY